MMRASMSPNTSSGQSTFFFAEGFLPRPFDCRLDPLQVGEVVLGYVHSLEFGLVDAFQVRVLQQNEIGVVVAQK